MIPVKKPWTNIVMGEGQPGVLPCPAYREGTGDVIVAFDLTDEEVEAIVKTNTVMVKSYCAGRNMQPIQLWAVDENEVAIPDNRNVF